MADNSPTSLPNQVRDEEHLDALLSEPSPGVVEVLSALPGDLLILGAGGKMGPTLAGMAKRATDLAGLGRQVVAVSRFSVPAIREQLQKYGVKTIKCDLLDSAQVERLPEAANVVIMTGMKFGATGQESLTWAMNAHLPAILCDKFRNSKIVAFSTGNVYGLSPIALGGSKESDPLNPIGEYAMSCVGRERMYEYFSRKFEIPMSILRLNYAHELRYGVMVDIARTVMQRQALDVTMGHFNAIWQGDANSQALQAFAHAATPPFVVNIAGPELLSTRRLAEEFAGLFEVEPTIYGEEANDAFVSDARLAHQLFGYPRVAVKQIVQWTADWIKRGGKSFNKPTHFENRQGKY